MFLRDLDVFFLGTAMVILLLLFYLDLLQGSHLQVNFTAVAAAFARVQIRGKICPGKNNTRSQTHGYY